MKLIAYYPWVYLKGGAERLLLELVTRSRHDWTIYTNHFDQESTFPELRGQPVVELGRVDVRRDISHVFAAGVTIALQRVETDGHEGALVLSEGLGNLMAGRFGVPTACLCLTPLKVAYEDVTRERFFSAPVGSRYRSAIAGFRAIDRRTWRHYAEVICISHEVRRRLLRSGLAAFDDTCVIHPGVDVDRFTPGDRREPFFLLAGRIMWQKRIEFGLEAWRWFKPHPDDNPFRLVIAGMVDAKSRPYLDELRRSVAWRHDVEFIVSPTDTQLLDLYRSCHSALFTAANEDFGLVVLEAMACGKPVVAPAQGGPTETVLDGETGALVVGDERAFAAALGWLAELPAERLDDMALKARTRASEFGWDSCVRAIDDRMDAVVTGRTADVLA